MMKRAGSADLVPLAANKTSAQRHGNQPIDNLYFTFCSRARLPAYISRLERMVNKKQKEKETPALSTFFLS